MKFFWIKITGIVLIIMGLGSLFYKSSVLKMDLRPTADVTTWEIVYTAKNTNKVLTTNLVYPRPSSTNFQTVNYSKARPPYYIKYNGKIKTGELFKTAFDVKFEKRRPKNTTLGDYKFPRVKYAVNIKDLASKFDDSNKKKYVDYVYAYLDHEISTSNKKIRTLDEVIFEEVGSTKNKTELFHQLLLLKKIPSRIVVGLDLTKHMARKMQFYTKKSWNFYNEYYVDGEWERVRMGDDKTTGKFLAFTNNYEAVKSTIELPMPEVSFVIRHKTATGIDGLTYSQNLKQKSGFYSSMNLFNLSLHNQNFFFYIMIIPFGALVLAFCRNIIGIKTFGIFMPILIGLYLVSMPFWVGFTILIVIVALGCFERYILDKLYLLAVPRLSIILTLMVLFFLGLALNQENFKILEPITFSAIPVIILAVFIEKLSVQLVEDGFAKTLPVLAGTLTIALIVYGLYQALGVRIFLFTHPEMLISIIGALLLIGTYHGYRLSELIRFKEFANEDKDV